MDLKTTNINYNYDMEGSLNNISISLSGNQDMDSISAYVVLEDDGTLEDLNKKQLTVKAIEKLKEMIGE